MRRAVRRITLMLAAVPAITLAVSQANAQAKSGSSSASSSMFREGYMDIGPTVGFGGIGSAGLAFGGRFERGIKRLPDLGDGTLGIEASLDYWSYNAGFSGIDYSWRYINIGVTGNYHINIKSNPKIDPFFGLGLGNSSVSTKFSGDYSSGIYFIGRAGVRYFPKEHLALYADAGAGASTLNVGVMFGIGGK